MVVLINDINIAIVYFCDMKGIKTGFQKQIDLEEEDFYLSPDGYLIFTEKYHLKRGHCCQSGCQHCPYGYNKKTGKIERKK